MRDSAASFLTRSRLLPLLVAAVVGLIALGFWHALSEQEAKAHLAILNTKAASAASEIGARNEALALALVRMARRSELRGANARTYWVSDARFYLMHYSALRRLLWLEPGGAGRWYAGRLADGSVLTDTDDPSRAWRNRLPPRCRVAGREASICAFRLAGGEPAIAIEAPIAPQGGPLGVIMAVLDGRQMLEIVLNPNVLPGFGIRVHTNDETIFERGHFDSRQPPRLSDDTPLAMPGVPWTLSVWATPGTIPHIPSQLPNLFLAGGLLLAGLLGGMTHFAQQASLRARALRDGNRALTAQIDKCSRAEEELRRERDFADGLIETARTIVLVLDPKGRIVRFNHFMEELSGYRLGEVKGKDWFTTFLPEGDRERIRALFARAISAIQTQGNINPIVTRDGHERLIEWYDTTLRDSADTVTGLLTVGQDITDRHRAETKLKESEERFRQLAENIREVFFMFDPREVRMLYISPVYEQLWGQSRESLYRDFWSFLDAVHPEDRERVRAATDDTIRTTGRFEMEYRILRPNGELRWVSVRGFPIRDETGTLYRVAGIAEDITGRKDREATRLAYARQQRDALVREVHHRIKNNLQGVIGLLRRHIDQRPEIREALEEALIQVDAIATVHGLQSRVPTQRIRIDQLIEAVVHMIERSYGAGTRAELSLSDCPAMSAPEAEAVPIALIVNELVCNAFKHSADRQPVRVTFTCEDAAAKLRIVNPAVALPEDFSFAEGRGLGTGLSLVKSLLPPAGATLSFRAEDAGVEAELSLVPPAIAVSNKK